MKVRSLGKDVRGNEHGIMAAAFGETRTEELCPEGSQRNLSQDNKHEFVRLYVDWVLNTNPGLRFEAFK